MPVPRLSDHRRASPLAAVLVFRPRVWPGIFLGASLTNETTAGSVVTSLLIASGNTLEALVGAIPCQPVRRGAVGV